MSRGEKSAHSTTKNGLDNHPNTNLRKQNQLKIFINQNIINMKKSLYFIMALLMLPLLGSAKKYFNPSELSRGWGDLEVSGLSAHFTGEPWTAGANLWLAGWDSETLSNVPLDLSPYEYFVVEFTEPLNTGVQLTLQTLQDEKWLNTAVGKADKGAKYVAVKLADADYDVSTTLNCYFQAQGYDLQFTIGYVWAGSAQEVAELGSQELLENWSAWESSISIENTSDGMTVDFGETPSWSGINRWFGDPYDASIYDFLVFELEEAPSDNCQFFIRYADKADWQKSYVDIQNIRGQKYVRMPLDADYKDKIQAIGLQNATADGLVVKIKSAYFIGKIDFVDITDHYWTELTGELNEKTRRIAANLDQFDYMVYECLPTTEAQTLKSENIAAQVAENPWWYQCTGSVEAQPNLITAFVPCDFGGHTMLWPHAVGHHGLSGADDGKLKRVYLATHEYLMNQGYTDADLQNQIYVEDLDFLDMAINKFDTGATAAELSYTDTSTDHTVVYASSSVPDWYNDSSSDGMGGILRWGEWHETITPYTQNLFYNYNNFDYVMIQFTVPTSDPIRFTLQAWGDNWSADDNMVSSQGVAEKNLLTYFLPVPKKEDGVVAVVFDMLLSAGSKTEISRIMFAKKDYLRYWMGFTEADLANHIYETAADYVMLPLDATVSGAAYVNAGATLEQISERDFKVEAPNDAKDWEEEDGNNPPGIFWYYNDENTEEVAKTVMNNYDAFDYMVINFAVPTSSQIKVRPMVYDSRWSVSTVGEENYTIAQPFCKTLFVPLPKLSDAKTGNVILVIDLKPGDIAHIQDVMLAKRDYLIDGYGYTAENIANNIYGTGVTVTIGTTGYATIYNGDEQGLVFPGGIHGYDYTSDAAYAPDDDVEDGKLRVLHTFEPDDLLGAWGMPAVLKADDWVKLPHTFYFPHHPYQTIGWQGQGSNLGGSAEDARTYNVTSYNEVYYYKLSTKNGKNVGFYWGAEDGGPFMNAAGKAYLVMPKDGEAMASGYVFDENMNLVPEGSTTGIAGVTDLDDTTTAPAYNLSGQRVGASYRGIVIQNGKKIRK